MRIKVGFGAVGLTGGEPGNLDNIASSTINNRDLSVVLDNDKVYFYRMDQYSGKEPNPPYIIKPADIRFDSPLQSRLKRWILVSQREVTNNIIQLKDNHIETSHLKSIGDLSIDSANGPSIIYYENGSILFPSLVHSEQEPIENNDITNKEYVDLQISILDQYTREYLDNLLVVFNDNIRPEVIEYITNAINNMENDMILYWEQSWDDTYTWTDETLNIKYDDFEDEVISYIDYGIEWLEFVYEPPEYNKKIVSSDIWTQDGLYWYTDIIHNIGTIEYFVSFWVNGELIQPFKSVDLDEDTLRVWVDFSDKTLYCAFGYIEPTS